MFMSLKRSLRLKTVRLSSRRVGKVCFLLVVVDGIGCLR